ncbi:MAG: SusE domain-containing protein [Ferruginibacter sp.]
MKNLVKMFLGSVLLAGIFLSCKKDENKIYLEGGSAPILTANQTATIPLSFLDKDNEAITFSWTNPEYKFTTGISSQDVTYLFEIDTAGANFTNPKKKQVSIGKELSRTFKQSEINDFLLNQLELAVSMPHNIEIRVKASLAGSLSSEYISNILKYSVTPFATPPKVAPPSTGTLWLTGDATNSGYANPLTTPYDVTQKFTKVTNTLYELAVDMKGGGAYKLIQEQGVWGTQYHMLAGGTWEGGEFEQKDSDPGFTGPGASGRYKISVDFQKGRYAVIKL